LSWNKNNNPGSRANAGAGITMLLLFAFNTGMFALIADMIDKRAAD
jgi:hypothetical protein